MIDTESKNVILYIGPFDLPDGNAAALRVFNNALNFHSYGYQVVFIEISNRGEVIQKEQIDQFTCYILPRIHSFKEIFCVRKDKNLMALIGKFTNIKMVICYDLYSIYYHSLFRFCRKKGVLLIADCTEWYNYNKSIKIQSIIKNIDTFFRMHYYQKRCDGMIVISRFLEKYYRKYLSNIVFVPPLVNLNSKKYKNLPPKDVSDKIRYVYCGSPSAAKESLGEVVSCFNTLKETNFIFRIVGITREQFVSMYHIEPDDKKICFEGRVSHTEALNIVRQSDYSIIIRPDNRTTKAGFPTKFVEAISCGTAVIANRNSDLVEYLKDGKNGYLIDEKDLLNEFKKIMQRNTLPEIQRDLFDYHLWSEPFRILLCNLNLI